MARVLRRAAGFTVLCLLVVFATARVVPPRTHALGLDELASFEPSRLFRDVVRISGTFVPGTLRRAAGSCDVTFAVEQDGRRVLVAHELPVRAGGPACSFPDAFCSSGRHSAELAAEGSYDRGNRVVHADALLTRPRSNYELCPRGSGSTCKPSRPFCSCPDAAAHTATPCRVER